MKVQFNSDDNLSLKKTLELDNVEIVAWSLLQENSKYYPYVFLDNCVNYRCYILIEYYIYKGIDINKTSASKFIFYNFFIIFYNKMIIIIYFLLATISYQYFLEKEFNFHLDVYNACHDVLMMSMNLNDIDFLNIHGADYRCMLI